MARLCGAKACMCPVQAARSWQWQKRPRPRSSIPKLEKGLELLEGLDGCEAFTLLQLDADNTGATVE